MPQTSPYKIALTDMEQARLGALSRQYTAPYYQVIRAKIILFAAEGLGNDQIAERLDIPRKSVVKWRQRFYHERLDGLEDQPRPGRPADFSP
jgi:transposase